jgi:hypothetical protein
VNKKKQKNFDLLRALALKPTNPAANRSFLLLFFKKEALACSWAAQNLIDIFVYMTMISFKETRHVDHNL